MNGYRAFLERSQAYAEDLAAQAGNIAADPIIKTFLLPSAQEIVDLTGRLLAGAIDAEAWRKGIWDILPVDVPIDALLSNGLRTTFETLYIEQPLGDAQWRRLIAADPLQARRRYCHQARLYSWNPEPLDPAHQLHTSIASYQRVAGRDPARFCNEATLLIRACARQIARWRAELPSLLALPDEWTAGFYRDIWRQLTDRPYGSDDPYQQFAGPTTLLEKAIQLLGITMYQISTWPRSERDDSVEDADVECATRKSPQLIDLLSIIVEEAQLPDPPATGPTAERPGTLAPYPNEAEWRRLLAANTRTTRTNLHRLELCAAGLGLQQPFNLGESLTAFGVASGECRRTLSF